MNIKEFEDSFGNIGDFRQEGKAFNKAFIDWTKKISKQTEVRIIAVDGKTLRRSHDGEKGAIHLVNAWVDENDLY